MSVLRSTHPLFCQMSAVELKSASREKPTISPRLLMVLQQGGPVPFTAPGNPPRSCMPVCGVHRKPCWVPSDACANPTTSPRSLMLVARLYTPGGTPSRCPRSMGVPSLFQSTACAAAGFWAGIEVSEHDPDPPTAWPLLLIIQANDTVSPAGGLSSWIAPLGSQTTASKRRTCEGVPGAHVSSRMPFSENPTTSPWSLIHHALALLPPGKVGSAVSFPFFQTAPMHCVW